MEKIKELIKNPKITGAAGLVGGLFIGLIILGWWLFPVQWTDASPADLAPNFKVDYLRSAVYAYSTDKDAGAAQARWSSLGDNKKAVLDKLLLDPTVNNQAIADFVTIIQQSSDAAILLPGETVTTGILVTPEAEKVKQPVSNTVLLSVLCILFIAIGFALVYILFVRKKKLGDDEDYYYPQPTAVERPPVVKNNFSAGGPAPSSRMTAVRSAVPVASPPSNEPPISRFMTYYTFGNDLYDDSFSIDSPTGEFLGECGVGISETLGVGDPKKVTAFEVWLFDKNDVQTVTKVVMSEHAWNDVAISQRLAIKGEPVLMDAGKSILLETATLVLEVRVVDASYGQGPLPPHSFFDGMTMELSIWTK